MDVCMYESRREGLKRLSSTNMYNSTCWFCFFRCFLALVVFAFRIRGWSAAELKLPREGKRSGGYMAVAVARTRERVREAGVGRRGEQSRLRRNTR